jgi:hypothetical protein
MDENYNESVETQEVAEPETEALESEETQEVAETAPETETPSEPQSGKNDADAAFAEMRRQNQALQHERELMMNALNRYFDGDTVEELVINANAYAEQRDPEDYRQEFELSRDFEDLKARNAELEEQLLDAQVERLMRDGLREVQAIDPNVKSLDDLGESFGRLIANGVPTKEAFYAARAMELKEKILAPDAIGRVSDTKAERDYYTSEELDNLTDEEMDANWDKVMRSMGRLNKR